MTERVRVELGGVPETALWTLYNRAAEAARPDAVIDDPLAVELVGRIDFPFAERFGPPRLGQWQALRARCFDRALARYLDVHPGATVVALGEGLETQFWRIGERRGGGSRRFPAWRRWRRCGCREGAARCSGSRSRCWRGRDGRGGGCSPFSRRSSPSPCRLCAGSPPPAGSVGSGW